MTRDSLSLRTKAQTFTRCHLTLRRPRQQGRPQGLQKGQGGRVAGHRQGGQKDRNLPGR